MKRFLPVLLLSAAAGCATAPPSRPAVTTVRIDAATSLSRITARPDAETAPTVSPDGTMIYFQSSRLAPVQDPEAEEVAGFWSPDLGQRILDWDVWARASNGRGGYVLLTEFEGFDGHPAASPDGGRVAILSHRAGGLGIWLIGADGVGASLVRPLRGAVSTPRPSPDGKRILFAVSESGRADDAWIWTVRVDGGELTEWTEGLHPSWSPDGQQICFLRHDAKEDRDDLWTMSADGGPLTQVTRFKRGTRAGPAVFSPDSQWIAFAMEIPGSETSEDLYIIRRDGTGLTRLTVSPGRERSPAWASDGFLYFAAETEPPRGSRNWDIWRLCPMVGT